MFKRLTDTDKWKKNAWFRKLPKDYKLFWLYLSDDCDNIGVWEVDIELANILMGTKVNERSSLEYFGDRIYEFESKKGSKKWWLVGFCDFQYSGKKKSFNPEIPTNLPQESYVNLLKSYGLLELAISISKGYPYPINTLSKGYERGMRTHNDNDNDNDNDNVLYSEDKGNEKKEDRKLELKRNKEQFELIWSVYPKKSGKKPAGDKYKVLMPKEDLFNLIYSDIVKRLKSHKWREEDGRFVPHLKTYLNQERWNDDMFPVDAPPQERGDAGRGPYIEDEEDS